MLDETKKKDLIKAEERIDELEIDGLKILQSSEEYCFTSDSVILANLVKASAKDKVLDLCSGSGIIATLIAAKTKAKEITGIEIQPGLADRANRSVSFNNLESRIKIFCMDAKDAARKLGHGSQDIVVCNPPYYRLGEGEMSNKSEIAICRHEVAITLKEIIEVSSKVLKYGGKLYIISKADRLSELICLLAHNKLEPKTLYSIQPAKNKAVDTVIVIAKHKGEGGLIMYNWLREELEKTLYIKR